MVRFRVRLTVRGMMVAIALLALPLAYLVYPSRPRRERCLDLADRHARVGAEYRRNAGGNAGMLRIADWHESMRAEFERAADEPWWRPIPGSSPFPPTSWVPPVPSGAAPR